MQAVFICGGKGTRLERNDRSPKSLARVGGATLLDRLAAQVGRFHCSTKPPVVVVAAGDRATPEAAVALLPFAAIVRQPEPDGVANALLLAQAFLDDLAIVTLGDLFLDGTFGPFPDGPGLTFWTGATAEDTSANFGIAVGGDGLAASVAEKPIEGTGLLCGMGVYLLTRAMISRFTHAPTDPRSGERGITDAIQAEIASGGRLRLTPFFGYYRNVNSRSDVADVEARRGRLAG